MSTATEVKIRMAEAERRLEPHRKVFSGLVVALFDAMTKAKVPCIKYGRMKRKKRLAIPRGSRPLPKLKINV